MHQRLLGSILAVIAMTLSACGGTTKTLTATTVSQVVTRESSSQRVNSPTARPARTEAATATRLPSKTPTARPAKTEKAFPNATRTRTVTPTRTATRAPTAKPTLTPSPIPTPLAPLMIEVLRQRKFLGSDIKIEQTLAPGVNYNQYVASYISDGLKIYALLTMPMGEKPPSGFPVIIFNHGFILPAQYRTTVRYTGYVDALARNGYIVFKSDYRGHGKSQGVAPGGYGSQDYTIDVLNGLASVKRLPQADPNRIGMWGHSMGGQITLRSMVTTHDIKAGVIWAGVVGKYVNLIGDWRTNFLQPAALLGGLSDAADSADEIAARQWPNNLIRQYGSPDDNPQFWADISPNTFVKDVSGPIQLHHALEDKEVPFVFAQELNDEVLQAGKKVELYQYPGDDHNLKNSFGQAMDRTVKFFDRYVKGASK